MTSTGPIWRTSLPSLSHKSWNQILRGAGCHICLNRSPSNPFVSGVSTTSNSSSNRRVTQTFKNPYSRQVFWTQRLRSPTILGSRCPLNAHGTGVKVLRPTKSLRFQVMFINFQPRTWDVISGWRQSHSTQIFMVRLWVSLGPFNSTSRLVSIWNRFLELVDLSFLFQLLWMMEGVASKWRMKAKRLSYTSIPTFWKYRLKTCKTGLGLKKANNSYNR